MSAPEFDPVDLDLLRLLAVDARLSQRELARRVSMSAPAVAERVARLERAGIIRGYRAEIDRERLGFPLVAIIGIEAVQGVEQQNLLKSLRTMPEVEDVHLITGPRDLLVRVQGPRPRSPQGVPLQRHLAAARRPTDRDVRGHGRDGGQALRCRTDRVGPPEHRLMCEIVAAAWPEPRPLRTLLERAVELERFGIDGFGWGVAWLDNGRDGGPRVRGYRSVTSLVDDTEGRDTLGPVESPRFVVHLRRPTLLSTVDLADTQPFVADDGRFALAHNGRFEHHERFRPRFAGRLAGRADSEVGFRVFEQLLRDGVPAPVALRRMFDDLGGHGNLVVLTADGELVALADHHLNPFWWFELDGGVVASTACHSDDDSVFRLVFTDALAPRPVARDGQVIAGPTTATMPSIIT